MKIKFSLVVIVSIMTVLFAVSAVSADEGIFTLKEKIANLQERLASAGVEVDVSGLDDARAEQKINAAVSDYVAKRDAQAIQDRSTVEEALQEQASILKAKLQDVGLEVNTDGLGAEEAYMKMRTVYNVYISGLATQSVDEQIISQNNVSQSDKPRTR